MTSTVSGAVVMPLGGGREVGRSCILLQFRGKNVLLDCGVHPGRDGEDSLPFFDVLIYSHPRRGPGVPKGAGK